MESIFNLEENENILQTQTCSKNLVTIYMQGARFFAHKELSQDCLRDWEKDCSLKGKTLLIA